MGFWSGICSAVSSGCKAIGNAISSGVSAISSGLSGVGNALGKIAENLSGKLATKLLYFVPVIGDIAMVIDLIVAVADMLGVFDKEENPEELGVKAEQAEKKPEDFESTQEYIKYLNEEVQIDQEAFDNLSEDEKLAYKITGASIILDGVAEKKGLDIDPTFVRDFAVAGFTAKEMDVLLDKFKDMKAKTNLDDYFKGEMSMKDEVKVSDSLEQGLKDIRPDEDPFKKITEIRDRTLGVEE